MKQVPLSDIQNDLARFLHEAEAEEIIITCNGKPARALIGFRSEQDWFINWNAPRFLHRIERARRSLGEGRGVRIENVE